MTLISEVARNYFELRGAQNQLAVARGNVENQRETLDMTRWRSSRPGRATELDTARARAQLDATLALIPPLEAAVKHSIYRLGVLTGQQPTALEAGARPARPHSRPAAAGQHRQPGRTAAPAAGHPLRRKLAGRRHRAHRR